MMSKQTEPFRNLRRRSVEERRGSLDEVYSFDREESDATGGQSSLLEIADLMVETAVGSNPLPIGLATNFRIDGLTYNIPMATEEPSVVAAATFAARIVGGSGGFRTYTSEPVMKAQIFLEEASAAAEEILTDRRDEIGSRVDRILSSLKDRGGGFRGLQTRRLARTGVLRVHLLIDVRDAMGANILDTAAEGLRGYLEELTGGRALMSILTNAAYERKTGAAFSLPLERLAHGYRTPLEPTEVARRIVLASEIASEDEERAVTHNKGIMNGISALALATGNDTRALEAASHAWASHGGRYRSLSRYEVREGILEANLELPLAFASVGGAVGFHPATRYCLRILGHPDAKRLARIAAALGLAQNFAALLALVTEGIQRGHMRYHAARVAYAAGARGREIRRVAEALSATGDFSRKKAQSILLSLRDSEESGDKPEAQGIGADQ
jgi:hydroxymethylglutaryl-CoA reductase